MDAPPDLRVLCRRLASTPVDDLPRLCPVLVSHVLRCGGPLSAPLDSKPKDKSSDTTVLVHKLRTHITTLLTGKSPAGRFVAVFLVKAVIDVGGWETLRASAPWLRGLIGVLNKPDPLASKELCIITLTKLYMLLQNYPTLVREMATPTLPDYVSACLQLIKPPASGKTLKVPTTFVDTVACSLSRLVVLYPTTLRPFASTMRGALRAYIAPTCSDPSLVPRCLRESSRRLFTLLSYTAPKNGSSEEWAKAIRSTILDVHATVDQIFRGVVESWESTTGYRSQAPHAGPDPTGGGESAEELPVWVGVQAGAERAIGLLEFLCEYLNSPTKAAVALPLGELLDLASRITLITPPSPGSEDSVPTNPAIGRDEKAELWSVLPDLHTAVLRLHHALLRRLGPNALPLATDMLDQMVRVYAASGQNTPSLRAAASGLIKDLLLLCGPTLPKLTVDSLAPLIQSTCHDVLLPTGHLSPEPAQPTANGTAPTQQQKKSTSSSTTNADAYLPGSTSSSTTTALSSVITEEAATLLPLFLSHLPQNHLSPDLRSLLDRTAILASHRTAMLASCLHPYRDGRGRCRPSVLPFLVKAFPRDQEVEVLRSNLLKVGGTGGSTGGMMMMMTEVVESGDAREEDEEGGSGEGGGEVKAPTNGGIVVPMEEDRKGANGIQQGEEAEARERSRANNNPWGVEMDVDTDTSAPQNQNPFAAVTATSSTTHTRSEEPAARPASPLKRKSEVSEAEDAGNPPKRLAAGEAKVATAVHTSPGGKGGDEDDDDDEGSDSEGSVQIDMTLDDEEEEEDDEGDDN
ncbi:hypothetical protein VTJ49DRAFT_1754 [Mycothermus thermophilus]|uniref:Pre-rRNA-processing protein RIX1 n=1 Tax=Humicola insolens TaxID=85995 RepID=A0ABR3VNB4_HUMIN